MAVGSNSNPHSRLSPILSALCVFALLLVGLPCAMCAPQASMHRATTAALQCDDCCSQAQLTSTAKACCAAQAPLAVSVVHALDAAPASIVLPAYRRLAVVAVQPAVRAVHPPLLKTNLRI